MTALTEAQADALLEVCNIGVSQAARQLSSLLNEEVIITVPEVSIISTESIYKKIGLSGNDDIPCISQNLYGDFEGTANLIFHTNEGKSLVNSLIGSLNVISGIDMRDLEHEALVEIGNIIISSCMSAIANFLNEEISFTIPYFREANKKKIINSHYSTQLNDEDSDYNESALVIATTLKTAKSEVSGSIIITLSVKSATLLVDKVNNIVQQYLGDSL